MSTNTPTRRQLDMMAARIAAGAEPADLARWISRVSGTRIPVDVLTAVAVDLRDGTADRWYTAAERCGTAWESQAAYQADVQRFVATDAQWAELQRALEAPVEPSPKLERLWERNTPFQD